MNVEGCSRKRSLQEVKVDILKEHHPKVNSRLERKGGAILRQSFFKYGNYRLCGMANFRGLQRDQSNVSELTVRMHKRNIA